MCVINRRNHFSHRIGFCEQDSSQKKWQNNRNSLKSVTWYSPRSKDTHHGQRRYVFIMPHHRQESTGGSDFSVLLLLFLISCVLVCLCFSALGYGNRRQEKVQSVFLWNRRDVSANTECWSVIGAEFVCFVNCIS